MDTNPSIPRIFSLILTFISLIFQTGLRVTVSCSQTKPFMCAVGHIDTYSSLGLIIYSVLTFYHSNTLIVEVNLHTS